MKKALSIVLSVLMLVCSLPSFSLANENELTVYPEYDSRILRCCDYGVSVTQGETTKELTVYNMNTTVEVLSSRSLYADNNRRFCEFAFSGEQVRVDIEVYADFESYSVLPSEKNFITSYSNGVISVWLDSPDEYFILELDNNYDTILSVFADSVENYNFDTNDSSVLVLNEPWYEPEGGVFSLPEGVSTVYIAPGSVLCARLLIKKAGVKICGHGAILDPWSNIFDYDINSQSLQHFVSLNAANITVSDVKLLDSQTFNICVYSNGDGARINDVKILSARMCTDGISVFGADNVQADRCFIYNGDNGIVFGGSNYSNSFNNCYIGTTCSAIFPQSSLPGDVTFNNTYIFRCDQGAVSNIYNQTNPGTTEREVAGVTFNNLSCVDVINFPYLFLGRNMGTLNKYFTFNNTKIPYSRGQVQFDAEKNGVAIMLTAGSASYMDTKNYHLSFENLWIDGALVSTPDEIGKNIAYPDETFITVMQNTPDSNAVTQKTSIATNSVYPYKVYVGSSLQSMKKQPVLYNGEIYLPVSEICKKLDINVPSGLTTKLINGAEMISLSQCSSKITKAEYSDSSGKICLGYSVPEGYNLFSENFSHLSLWNELVCYNSSLNAFELNGEQVYRSRVTSAADNHTGMVIMLTDRLKKSGKDRYLLSFSAKSTDGTNMQGWYRLIFRGGSSALSGDISYTGEWTEYSFTLNLNASEFANASYICFELLTADKGAYDVQFKNLSLTAIPKTEEDLLFDRFNENGLLKWTQIPIVSETLLQTEQVTTGGEGCQWPLAISTSFDGSLILLGTDVGGIFRSVDGGKSYTPQNAGLTCHGASAFAIDPTNNNRVLAVGVGSKYFSMNGVFLSVDRGNTWNQKLKSVINGTRDVRDSIAFDPSSYDESIGGCAVAYYSILYTDSTKQDISVMGLFKTTDGGETWSLINSELYNAIIKVGSDGTVYAAQDTAIYRSVDKGESFSVCYTGEVTGFDLVKDSQINADKLVVCDKTGIAVSYNGTSFEKNDAPTYPTAQTVSGLEGYAQNVMISPADSNYMLVCYVRSNGFNNVNYYTHDGGNSWTKSVLSNDYTMMSVVGGRTCTFAWVGNDKNKVYSFGGDIITSSVDGGARFDWDANGFNAILCGGEFHFNIYDSDIMYFGAQDYNGAVTTDGGVSWKYVNFSGNGWGGNCYGGYAADENTYFVGVASGWDTDREICITYDGGKTIIHTGVTYSVNEGLITRGLESAYQSAKNPNIFFQTAFRSPDGGKTWSRMTNCTGVYAHDTDTGRLYGIDETRHYCVYSDDDGITWTNLNTQPIGTNYLISDISADSKNNLVYVAYGSKCVARVNTDGSWDCIMSKDMNNAPINDRNNIIVNCIAVDPNHPQVLYCGGSGDYYMNTSSTLRSVDGGETWQCVTPNLINSIISPETTQCGYETISLSVDPETSELWQAGGCLGFAKLSSPCNGCANHTEVKRKELTVSYMANGTLFESQSVELGLFALTPAVAPAAENMVFTGWYEDEDCSVKFDFNTRIEADKTLYARFTDKITLTLISGASTQSVTAGKGTAAELPLAPEYSGLCFAGWYTDKARTSLFDENTPLTENLTLYAGYYQNLYDSSVNDYAAYIANSTHAMSSVSKVYNGQITDNRVTYCTVEPGKTYGISIDMDCRFRGGCVEKVTKGEVISNYFQDVQDINGLKYVGGTKKAEITPLQNQTTLLIFYWTSYDGCTDYMTTRSSIAVYDPLNVILPPDANSEPEEPTEPPTEPTTEPTTEPATEPTTEPATEPTSYIVFCFLYIFVLQSVCG